MTSAIVSSRYRTWVLSVFVAANAFNFLDRQILAILLQPIKDELGASDTQMGFLTGIAFALFYTVAGLPMARWADRGVRRSIMALGIALWSAMTAISGLARSFVQLALARVAVGVGEAALTPCAHSLIADYFPPRRRGIAMAFHTVGAQLGLLIGLGLGGWIYEHYGWRWAFFALGAPGLAIAAIVRLTIREPARGQSEQLTAEATPEPFSAVLRFLWEMRSFRHLALAASLQAFFGYGLLSWAPTFMIRVHGLSPGEIGLPLGLILGGGGAIGSLLGGGLADRLATRDPRWYVFLPALTSLAMSPFVLLFLYWHGATAAMLFYLPAVILGNFYPAPTYALTQGLVRPRMRGTAAAVLQLVINLIGLGLGPQLVGIFNDALAPRLGDEAIRYSLTLVAVTNVWAAFHFYRASHRLRHDLSARDRS